VRHQALRAPQRSDVRLLAGATAHEFNFIWAASDWVTADDVADGLAKAGMSAAGIASYLRPGEDRRPGGIVGQALSDRTFRVPAQEMAAAKTAAGGAAYAYDFRWASPAGPLRGLSFHCLDMPFAFDLLGEAGVREAAGDAPPAALAAEMHGAWTRFITEGDPGWPRYNLTTRPVRVLDETSVTLDDPLRRNARPGPYRRPWRAAGDTETRVRCPVQELSMPSAALMSWIACSSAGLTCLPPSRWAAATLLATVSTKRR
jgi:para-nitrobenzyl esterase